MMLEKWDLYFAENTLSLWQELRWAIQGPWVILIMFSRYSNKLNQRWYTNVIDPERVRRRCRFLTFGDIQFQRK